MPFGPDSAALFLSDLSHADEAWRSDGKVLSFRAERDHFRYRKIVKNVHHPLHPHWHMCLFLKMLGR